MPIPANVFNHAVRGFWNQRIAQRQAKELLGSGSANLYGVLESAQQPLILHITPVRH